MNSDALIGQTAIVTGGGLGIGAATALDLAGLGADVALCDLDTRENVEELLDKIENLGRRVLYFRGDVGDRAQMEQFFSTTIDRFGHLDILVNNAGMNIRKPLIDLEVSDVEKVWAVTLWGVFHCSQLAARHMVKRGGGGSIVNISSVHAVNGYPLSTAYNAAKAAVNQMTRTWAAELAHHKIRVNAIEPGWIDTPGERRQATEEQLMERGSKLPLGRLGRADEIARAVAFLVSQDGSYITGTCLRVDGGYVLPQYEPTS